MAESIAQNYFEKFTGADAAAVISNLPNTHPKTFEDNWLDFKSGKTLPDHLEALWSKALGAMANAGGGVVVWGITAKKHGKPPVDAAESVDFVPDVNAFASRLTEICHFATDPPLAEVQIRAIPKAEGEKEGFVVCLIPEGRTKPYQSLKGKRPFYMRIGDESKEPPLPLLRQLFYPQRNIRLRVAMEPIDLGRRMPLIRLPTQELLPSLCFRLTIENIGNYTAEHVSVKVYNEKAHMHLKWEYPNDKFASIPTTSLSEFYSIGVALNPSAEHKVKLISSLRHNLQISPTTFRYTIYGKDLTPLTAEIVYQGELIKAECV